MTPDEIQAEIQAQVLRARRRVEESQELIELAARHCAESLPKIRSAQEKRRRHNRAG